MNQTDGNTLKPVAFLGAGQMGRGMIPRLAAAGYPVRVWNRTPESARALEGDGVVACATPAEAVEGAGFVVSMLTDGPTVIAVVEDNGLAEAMAPGSVFIDMSSTRPEDARRLASLLADGGISFCDAPVSGGSTGARDGTLAIMAGCDEEVFDAVRPVLAAMGRPTRVGPVASGQLAKLANQAIVGAAIGAVAEAMLLVREGGGDMDAFRDALTGGFADSKVLQQHGRRMAAGDYEPGGRSSLHLKDMRNIVAEAGELGLTLPMSEMVRDRFARLCGELDGAGLDHAALFVELAERNGRKS